MSKNIFAVYTLISLLGITSNFAFAEGFASGDTFAATNLSGRLTVFCNGRDSFDPGPQIGDFFCDDSVLDPVEQDYFVTDLSVNADKVTLINKIKNKEIKKTKSYSPADKRSTGRFNLSISTLFQTPLLKMGVNEISYELKKGNKVVKSGQFVVNVVENPKRTCKNGVMTSNNNNDCRNSSFMCSRYFAEENYCQY